MSQNARRRPLTTDGAQRIDHRDTIGPLNNPIVTGLQILTQTLPIRIVVKPTTSGRKWRASLNGEKLCESTAPLVTAARLLIARGFDPACTIEMWHQGADAWSLRGRLGTVAAACLDGERKAPRRARNGVPIRLLVEVAP